MVRWLGLAALLLAAFGWGLAAGAYDVFPYPQARAVKQTLLGPDANANTEYQLSEVPAISAERYKALDTSADIVMAGDSITGSGRWQELFPEASIINRGVNGDRVGGLLARADTILQARPARVFVMIGINDIAARNTNAQILERYGKLIDALGGQGAEVFVQSVLPCRATRFSVCDDAMREQAVALNRALASLASEKGARYIALADEMADANGVLEVYSIDGIHPGSAGFAKWRDLIAPLVAATGASR